MASKIKMLAFRSMLISGLFAGGCSQDQKPQDHTESQTNVEITEPSLEVREIELPTGGQGKVKTAGWTIPDPASAEITRHSEPQRAKTLDGIEVDVESTMHRFQFGDKLVSSDMAAVLRMGDLNIQQLHKYEASGRIFAYVFTVNQVDLDKASNKIKSSRGVLFNFAVYDRDGDGEFETLTSNEPSVSKSGTPHVPAWVKK